MFLLQGSCIDRLSRWDSKVWCIHRNWCCTFYWIASACQNLMHDARITFVIWEFKVSFSKLYLVHGLLHSCIVANEREAHTMVEVKIQFGSTSLIIYHCVDWWHMHHMIHDLYKTIEFLKTRLFPQCLSPRKILAMLIILKANISL